VPVTQPIPLARIVEQRAVWLMGVGHFATNYGFYFLLTWLPLYLVKSRGYTLADMTLLTTLGFAAQGVVALVMGRMSDRWVSGGADEGTVRRWLMVIGQVIAAVALATVYFTANKVQLGAVLMLAGMASGLTSTNLFAIGQIFAGPRAAGGWIGVQNAIGNFAGIIGPIVTGLMVDYLGGYGYAFALTALVPALGALWWAKVVPTIEQVID
jgi:MFS family permease